MGWFEGARSRLGLLFARAEAESRMEEEIRLHLELEAERLVGEEGLDPGEAMRRARVAFGGVEQTKEELREGRGLAWLSGLRLDLKLGARMLLKYPVLTVASVLALAIAVALAASWFTFMGNLIRPDLPVPEGDRVVTVRNRDLAAASVEPRSLHDFETWREELEAVDDLTAVSPTSFNLTTDAQRFATVRGARVSPAMFGLVRVGPLFGRGLLEADFERGAEPAVVLAHSAWERLYDGDRSALGQTVRLGSEYATVVGVMPSGFEFPVNQQAWVPLRATGLDYERRDGPPLSIYGRLAPGVTVREAQAELELIGQRTTAEHPTTHEHLRPEVQRFGRGSGMTAPALLLNIPFLLFLLVVSANVATLHFARTASRGSEIALRSALGASRRRIILQLVAEALVLTSVAAALGIAAAHWGLRWGMDLFWEVQQTRPPFWFRSGLFPAAMAYAATLAVVGALVIGGVPGLRATGPRLRDRIAQPGAGGAGMRFGVVSTAVIVLQVAISVAFIPVAVINGQELLTETRTTDFPADSYLSGRLVYQASGSPRETGDGAGAGAGAHESRAAALLDEVHRRIAAEPGVLAATRTSRLPGFNHPVEGIEVEGDSATIVWARQNAIDPNFFDVLGASIISGRAFNAGDVTAEAPVAIVDRQWAGENFGGGNAVGQRIRYPRRSGEDGARWYRIVGVVAGMDRAIGPGEPVGVYHPLRPGERTSVQIYLRTASFPAALAPRIQDAVTALDPDLGLADLMPLYEVWRPVERANVFFATALSIVAVIILLFALIGIYALMSFTVTRRAREIGIRAALGANPSRIIVAIFSRALGQLGLGVVLGAALVSLTIARSPEGLRVVAGVAAAVVAVGLLSCAVPARRALRIQPGEALRSE